MRPSPAISVVEAAGGCTMPVNDMNTPQIPSASAAVTILHGSVISALADSGMKCSSRAWHDQPIPAPIRCERIVFRGADIGDEGA